MNKIQTEIADAILQYTYNNGRGSYLGVKDYLYFRVDKPLYSLKDINIVLGVLLGSKLLKGEAKMFFLTEEGEKAMRIGYAKYNEMVDRESQIKKNIEITTLITNWWNIAGYIVIIVTFIAGVLLSPQVKGLANKLISFFSF